MSIKRFEDIEAWQMARELTRTIYLLTASECFKKDYGLRDQITRASGSIMNNISEGFESDSNPEFIRFLGYARRSCSEVQSQLYIALDCCYIEQDKFDQLYKDASIIRSKIAGFMKYLKATPRP